MDGDGNPKDDVKVPDSDLGRDIEKDFEAGKDLMVTIVSAMGTCRSLAVKSPCGAEFPGSHAPLLNTLSTPLTRR